MLRNLCVFVIPLGAACGEIYGVGDLSVGVGGSSPSVAAGGDAPSAGAGGDTPSAAGGDTPSAAGSGGAGGPASAGANTRAGASGTATEGDTTSPSGGAGGEGSQMDTTSPSAGAGGEGSETDTTSPGAGGDGAEPTDVPPSCRGLSAICGTMASASRDCCHSPEVPGGSFFRSYDGVSGEGWDAAVWPASVGAFRLDAYEVTVGRFRRYVAAYPSRPSVGAGKNPANATDSGWSEEWSALLPPNAAALSDALAACGAASETEPSLSTWTAMPDANEALPVNCVTWFEAFAFCAWDGGRLPTEAEWNYAAAGGAEARVYPWPSFLLTDLDSNYAVYGGPIASPVGSKPMGNGLFGQSDLAGNVWEWSVDWIAEYRVPCDDCAELVGDANTSGRALRGGAYYNDTQYLRAAERGLAAPTKRDPGYGFRCARDD